MSASRKHWRTAEKPARKRRKPLPYVAPFEPCASCCSGWVLNRDGMASRCWCWLQYQQRATEAQAKYSQAETVTR